MGTETEKLLTERLKAIDLQIERLRGEKLNIKQALNLFKAQESETVNFREVTRYKERTFKDRIIDILTNSLPQGGTAQEILQQLNATQERPIKRESLSPQLSRLRYDEKVIGYNPSSSTWYLITPTSFKEDEE